MRLIDAEALKQTFCAECDHSIKCEDCDIDYHFEHLAPTVEAVEVVRCKDCKRYRHDDVFHRWYCSIGMTKRATSKDDYCSWGEKREDET